MHNLNGNPHSQTETVCEAIGYSNAAYVALEGIVLDLSQTTVTSGDLGNALGSVQGSINAGGGTVNITDIIIMPK